MTIDLSKFNPQQREAILHEKGPCLVFAGAGSGKTSVLTARIARLVGDCGVAPSQILAITFTNKAAEEMRARIGKLVGEEATKAMWVMTFHAACIRILRMNVEAAGLKPGFTIYDEHDTEELLLDCIERLGFDPKVYKKGAARSVISRGKSRGHGPDSLRGENAEKRDRVWAQVWELYDQMLAERNVVDFDDILLRTRRLLRSHPDVLAKLQDRWQYQLVDETQDTSAVQYDIVVMLAARDRNIFVVGDTDQSIYRFRGAEVKNILTFERTFPEVRTILLERNYRSTRRILDAANAVIANNVERPEKNLWTDRDGGAPIVRATFEDAAEEAAWVAGKVAALRTKGIGGEQVAVLCRRRQIGREMEKALLSMRIPCRLVGTGPAFFARKDVRDLLAYLKAGVNPDDDLAVRRTLNTPRRSVGDTAVAQLRAFAEAERLTLAQAVARVTEAGLAPRATDGLLGLHDVLVRVRELVQASAGARFVLDAVVGATGFAQYLADDKKEGEARTRLLDELLEIAASHESVEQLLETAGLSGDQDDIKDDGRVTISTIHAAKGLEWPVVFVPAMEEGVFPDERCSDDEEIEEERRLCYVAITRARQRLFLSNALRRQTNGTWGAQEASRFVDEIPAELMTVEDVPRRTMAPPRPPTWRDGPAGRLSDSEKERGRSGGRPPWAGRSGAARRTGAPWSGARG